MGFSLEMFFEELRMITEDADLSDAERLEKYETAIQEGETYARQCGMIS